MGNFFSWIIQEMNFFSAMTLKIACFSVVIIYFLLEEKNGSCYRVVNVYTFCFIAHGRKMGNFFSRIIQEMNFSSALTLKIACFSVVIIYFLLEEKNSSCYRVVNVYTFCFIAHGRKMGNFFSRIIPEMNFSSALTLKIACFSFVIIYFSLEKKWLLLLLPRG